MVVVAQLVRASDCGSEGRGFEPHFPPKLRHLSMPFFMLICRGQAEKLGDKLNIKKLLQIIFHKKI